MSSKISAIDDERNGVSRRDFMRVVPLAIAGVATLDAFGVPLSERPIRLTDDWRGLQIREYVLTIAGARTRLAYDLAKYLDRAYIRRAYTRLPGQVTEFHADLASQAIVVADPREARIQSGAFVRTANWIYYDSVSPRPFKDVTVDEMRCALHPAIRDRFGAVPFPCGLREPFHSGWEPQYQATLEFYRKYLGTDDMDFEQCDLEYVRPAQTMERLSAGNPPVVTFGIKDKSSTPIKRAQLFGPEAA